MVSVIFHALFEFQRFQISGMKLVTISLPHWLSASKGPWEVSTSALSNKWDSETKRNFCGFCPRRYCTSFHCLCVYRMASHISQMYILYRHICLTIRQRTHQSLYKKTNSSWLSLHTWQTGPLWPFQLIKRTTKTINAECALFILSCVMKLHH